MAEVEAMERAGDISGLIGALTDTDWVVRKSAAESLGRLGAGEALQPLADALADPYSYDPTEGAENHAEIIEWAAEDYYPVREAAHEALVEILTKQRGELPDTYAMKAAADTAGLQAAILYGRDDTVSRLRQTVEEPALRELLDELYAEAWRCRERAVRDLGAVMGDSRRSDAFVAALQDPIASVRKWACFELAGHGDAAALEPLVGALGDEDYYVRSEACSALGYLGDQRAVEPLIVALGDWVPEVRRTAATALGTLGGERVTTALTAAADDSNGDVRRSVEQALEKAQANA